MSPSLEPSTTRPPSTSGPGGQRAAWSSRPTAVGRCPPTARRLRRRARLRRQFHRRRSDATRVASCSESPPRPAVQVLTHSALRNDVDQLGGRIDFLVAARGERRANAAAPSAASTTRARFAANIRNLPARPALRLRRRGRNFAADIAQLQLDSRRDRPGPWIQQPAPRHIPPARPAHRPSQPARRRGSRASAQRTRRPSRRRAAAAPHRACPSGSASAPGAAARSDASSSSFDVSTTCRNCLHGLVEAARIDVALGQQQAALLRVGGLRMIAGQIVQQPAGLVDVVARQRLLEVRVDLRGLRRPAAARYVCQY